jgi:hypothetical protein
VIINHLVAIFRENPMSLFQFSDQEDPPPERADALTCPMCKHQCRPGELLCPKCGFAFHRHGQTRVIDSGDSPLPDPISRPLYAGLVAKRQLITFEIEGEQLVVPITDQIVVGRSSDRDNTQPDVDLAPFGANEKGISRGHAQISCNGPLVYVTDLGSLNGTRLNGVVLVPEVARLLRDGDTLQLGKLTLKVKL